MSDSYSPPEAVPATEVPALPRRFALPWDLSEWLDRAELCRWAVEEVGRLAWDQPELVTYLQERPTYRPRPLLALVCYAYSIGVFEDGEVADLPLADTAVRASTEEYVPSKREVGAFRRANRGLIKWVLVELFRRILRERFQLGGTVLPAGLKGYLVRAASARLNLARMMVRATEEA